MVKVRWTQRAVDDLEQIHRHVRIPLQIRLEHRELNSIDLGCTLRNSIENIDRLIFI